MKRRILITSFVIATIHFLLAIGSLLVSFSLGMGRFDDLVYKGPSPVEKAADTLTRILNQPGMSIWNSWASRHLPGAFEWGLLLANSCLWGLVLAILFRSRGLLRNVTRASSP